MGHPDPSPEAPLPVDSEAAPLHPSTPEGDSKDSPPETPRPGGTTPKPRGRRRTTAILALLIAATVAGTYYVVLNRVRGPVSDAISRDSRNSGLIIKASYCSLVRMSCLVLDLTEATAVAPADVFRALFQSAEALYDQDLRFESVVLSRAGTAVFVLDGQDFRDLGLQFSAGQNPLVMIRSLPEKLKFPSGRSAYQGWTGGWLGVMKAQLEDANDAAHKWVDGA